MQQEKTIRTIPDFFNAVCDKYGSSRPAFLYQRDGAFVRISHEELRRRVEAFAVGLIELGIHRGDRVGIVSENRIEWIIADLAIISLGAINVPVFPMLTAKQEEYIYRNCGAAAVIVSNSMQLSKALSFKENVPSLRHIIVMEDVPSPRKELFIKTMSEISRRGETLVSDDERAAIIEERLERIDPDDLLTLIYTSGTTGEPKGVMLTHRNMLTNVRDAREAFGELEGELTLSFLPISHAYERMAGYYTMLFHGATIALVDSLDAVARSMTELEPTLMTSVPRLLEVIRRKMYAAIEKEGGSKKKIFNWAVNVGVNYIRKKLDGKNPIILAGEYKLAEKLVFSKLRERLGGRLKMFVTGGAAISEDVQEFFMAIGVHVLQGYGLTEASPAVALSSVSNLEVGTVGAPLPSLELKIALDGEILVRGPSVMKGYWKDPVATREAIDEEGWLYTGDVGLLTRKGNLKITDRKKHIFVSSGGKNIAPQPIEKLIEESKYVEHCVLIGESREYCSALLTPNYEHIRTLAEEFGIKYDREEDLVNNQKIVNHIKRDIDYLQRDLAKFERVRRFSMLSRPFSIEEGELSAKLSVKRHVVEQKYSRIIEDMYDED
ncbi:MAG: AMP-dependent synthetase/ligase [Chloroflexota bacterium]